MSTEYKEYRKIQQQISCTKQIFTQELSSALNLVKVECPILTRVGDGTQDNLSGFEKAVSVRVKDIPEANYEVVHSLAKWKRMTLGDHEFPVGYGLVTDMRALRVEETLDSIHSVYVDQWDWELVMTPEERTIAFLQNIVRKIYGAIRATELELSKRYPELTPMLPEKIAFVHTEQLLQKYPNLDPKSRERMAAKKFGAVFLIGIGGKLTNGDRHDARAPDYDDWSSPVEIDESKIGIPRSSSAAEVNNEHKQSSSITEEQQLQQESLPSTHPSINAYISLKGLNGDILVYNEAMDDVLELSSMGIRVDSTTLLRQLEITGDNERLQYGWHQRLIKGNLPQTVGGGIGQSRLTMFLLRKKHIGEVQCSVWPLETISKHHVLETPLS